MSTGTADGTETDMVLKTLLGGTRSDTVEGLARPVILWSGAADAVLWSNAAAPVLFGMTDALPSFTSAVPGVARLRGFARTAQPGDTLRETLRFFVGGRLEGLKTETLALELADGSTALLSAFGEGPGLDIAATLPPPPVPAPAPVHAAEPVADPPRATAFPSAPSRAASRPARFIFLTDAEGRLLSLSAAFRQLTGTDPSELLGQSLADVVADIDPLRGADMARAMFSRSTWSGIVVDWPGENGEMPSIEFSASPVFDPARSFVGYNGFGMVRGPRPPEAPAHDPAPKAPEPAPVAQGTDTRHTDTAHPDVTPRPASHAAGARATEPLSPHTPAEPVFQASAAALREAAEREAEEREAEERLAELLARDAEPDQVALDADDDNDDDSGETALSAPEPLASAERAPALPAVASREKDETPPAKSEELPLTDSGRDVGAARQDNALSANTVIPLRTVAGSVGASLGEKKVIPLKPSRPQDQGLTHSERSAFREIARALGARIDGAAPEAEAHASPEPPFASVTPLAEPVRPVPNRDAPENRVAAAQAEISKALQAAYEQTSASAGAGEPPRRPAAPSLSDILVERVPVGVLVFRGDKPIYMNRPLLDLLGYSDINEFVAHDGLEKLFRGRAAPSFSNGEYDTITIMGRNGQTLPADAHLQAIDWNGEHATMVTFRRALDAEHGPRARSLDVELKARQGELAETRAMLDTATDGVISLDENGRILALNKSAEALFGYDQNELAGERLTLLLAPESHAAALDYIDGLKTGGVASVLNDGREIVGKERKGGRIPLFMTIGRISDTSKFAAVVRDLTAWKRAETELTEAKRAAERSSALKSDFLAKVSHEIRTPMNAIIGFAEVMRDERLGPIGTERYKDYLKDIHTSGEHVISLVNDLLDLSKIEAGRLELSFGSVDLNAIVTSCLGIMQPQANRDRVIMRSQLSAKLPPVVADERSIRQIILNLLSNASKFTEPGGQVIISTALTEAGEAVIRVRDTGVGMTDSDVQAAMEPFRQLSNARGRGGTGLGLPLTKALVEANRASFSIKSKVREGTLVEITFPPTRVLAE